MVACFTSLSPQALADLQNDEDQIEAYLYPDDGDSESPNYIDLDKAWHGVHYLLAGTAEGGEEPHSLAVFGGKEFGPEMGYGPARYLEVSDVQRIAALLDALPPEELAKRFNAADMEAKNIYPENIWVRDGQEALDYVLDNYQQLQVFYRDAASRGEAVIQWLS